MGRYQDLSHFGIENRTYSLEEWLAIEQRTGEKFEYHEGQLVHWQMMAGGSPTHSVISANFLYVLGKGVREMQARVESDSFCRVHSSNLQINIATEARYIYPDAAIVCGEPVVDTSISTAITNPIVVAEVLSPSSVSYDTGEKFEFYARLSALREYVLISQESAYVEVRSREHLDGPWTIRFYSLNDNVLELPSLSLRLSMSEVYRGVAVGDML